VTGRGGGGGVKSDTAPCRANGSMRAVGSASAAAAAPLSAAATPAAADAGPAIWLGAHPADVLSYALAGLASRELARLASTCMYMWRGAGAPWAPGARGGRFGFGH